MKEWDQSTPNGLLVDILMTSATYSLLMASGRRWQYQTKCYALHDFFKQGTLKKK